MAPRAPLVDRINDALKRVREQPAAPAVVEAVAAPVEGPHVAALRDKLSGAFAEAIQVVTLVGKERGYLVAVPAAKLKASGLKFVESVCPPRHRDNDRGQIIRVLTGNPDAVTNACNRVAKPLGEGWTVALDSFPANAAADPLIYFRVEPTA